jgi:class 3 adenylate cyclase/pimeloyl-ACP methyl ester carboxylesterase
MLMSGSNVSDLIGRSSERRKLIAVVYADMVGYSRLIALDDAGTLERLRTLRRNLIDPAIAEHGGNIVQTGGDSLLIVFDSIDGAVRCAVNVQQQVPIHDGDQPPDRAIRFRVGINIGDAIADGTDLHGDAVNVAARLQTECPPGGICVTRAVRDHVQDRLNLAFEALGPLTLKNITRPVEGFVLRLDGTGDRLDERLLADGIIPTTIVQPMPSIRYCTTADGVCLAYMTLGDGPAFVTVGHWFGHLQLDWENPARHHFRERLGRGRTLLSYDARGSGLSDRNVNRISPDLWRSDLETVVDAAGLERFAIYGASQTSSVAIAYAAHHPERVTHLIVYGGFAQGWKHRPGVNLDEHRAMVTLTRLGWDRDDPAFRQVFTAQMMPDATKAEFDAFTEMGRKCASGECAARYLEAVGDVEIVSLLPLITVPTLVLHVRDDLRVPFECGRQIAASIPGARLIALPGRNHILRDSEPARAQLLDEIDRFLRG